MALDAYRRSLLTSLSLLGAAMAVSFHSLCNLIFSCGCRPLWAGGVAHCNIHLAGAHPCPFCTGGPLQLAVVSMLSLGLPILIVCIAGMRSARRPTLGWLLALGGLAYLVSTALAGLLLGTLSGYPSWLGHPLTPRTQREVSGLAPGSHDAALRSGFTALCH